MPRKSAKPLRNSSVRSAPAIFPGQVAAVCYRLSGDRLEFLLVTNKQGHWTFPKGNIAAGLTPVAAVRMEAREEAGAIGEVHPQLLHTYIHRKNRERFSEQLAMRMVQAYLLEVHSQRVPEERFRRPAWFDAVTAKVMLAGGREERFARELHGVIDAAVERLNEKCLGGGA